MKGDDTGRRCSEGAAVLRCGGDGVIGAIVRRWRVLA